MQWRITLFMFGLLILFVESALAEGREVLPSPVRYLLPPFHLQDMQGDMQHLSRYYGQWVLVNIWASWCAPCREEIPGMNKAWNRLKGEGFQMFAINYGEDREVIDLFLEDYPIRFPVLLDEHSQMATRWGVNRLPMTFVINPEGEVVYRLTGKYDWKSEKLQQAILALSGHH